ncbi:hypothetical protein C4K13_3094 [Pseudomonas chlororaphis subsp. aureofaciens]|nr:hypothetical protein C4K13_3094 [Pseudomonas chlororaphis subsp. aureofaciens]
MAVKAPCSRCQATARLRSATQLPQNLSLRCVRQNALPGLRPLRGRAQPRCRSAAATGMRVGRVVESVGASGRRSDLLAMTIAWALPVLTGFAEVSRQLRCRSQPRAARQRLPKLPVAAAAGCDRGRRTRYQP